LDSWNHLSDVAVVIDWIWTDPLEDDDETGSTGFNDTFESEPDEE